MKGRFFKIEDLLSLTIRDLQENTPLLDISRPTIATVLKAYKEKYKNKKTKPAPSDNKNRQIKTKVEPGSLHPDEIAKIRKMIDWFESQMEDSLMTLEDLKSALTDIGMDYKKLLARYRAKI